MECKVKGRDFFSFLKKADYITTKHPIYQAILLEFDEKEGLLKLTTQNEGQGFMGKLKPLFIKGSGKCALSCERFLKIVKSFGDEEINLVYVSPFLRVLDNNEEILFELNTIEADDFPLPSLEEGSSSFEIEVNSKDLLELFKKTCFAALRDDGLILSGVLIEAEGGVLRVVASDGYRLALRESAIDVGVNFSVVVSQQAVEWLIDNLEEERVKIRLNGSFFIFETDEWQFWARVISGSYPDYRVVLKDVIEREDSSCKFRREELLSALKRAIVVQDTKYKPVKFSFSLLDTVLEASSLEEEQGKAKIRVGSVLEGGLPEDISVNGPFLLDVLQAVDGEWVQIRVKDKERPLYLRVVGDEAFHYLVMPMII
ncbi:MAG: DNA polymerase III subunit beta [Desulfurococcaceae archaeon]